MAAEAGCSLGAVQKAFSSKELLLSAAFSRLRETAGGIPPGEPGRPTLHGWLLRLLMGLLPLDDRRRAAQRQGDAFSQWALQTPSVAAAIAESDEHLRQLLAGLVARARAEGEIPSRVDPEVTAWSVLALAQGLAAQLLYAPRPEAEVESRLSAALSALLD